MARTEPEAGEQSARTALAWQRLGLSVLVAAAVLARLTYGDLGPWALVVLAVCLGACGWVLRQSRGRPRGRPGADGGRVGAWAAAVSASVVVLGLGELAALVVP